MGVLHPKTLFDLLRLGQGVRHNNHVMYYYACHCKEGTQISIYIHTYIHGILTCGCILCEFFFFIQTRWLLLCSISVNSSCERLRIDSSRSSFPPLLEILLPCLVTGLIVRDSSVPSRGWRGVNRLSYVGRSSSTRL